MMLIEVFNSHGQRLEKEIFQKELVKVGRHSSNDFIIADLKIPLHWFEVVKEKENEWKIRLPDREEVFTTLLEIKVDIYLLRFVNLEWMDEQPHSGSLLNREPLSFKLQKARSLQLWILFNLFYTVYFVLVTWQKKYWIDYVNEFFIVNAIIFVPAFVLSILSQAINKKYRFKELFYIQIIGLFILSFIKLDFFGLRWIIGEWASFRILVHILLLGLAAFYVFRVSQIIFDHIRRPWRLGILGLASLIAVFVLFQKHLPLKDNYQFFQKDDGPLLYPLFEKSPISIQDLTESLSQQMSKQSGRAEKLKEKMKSQ